MPVECRRGAEGVGDVQQAVGTRVPQLLGQGLRRVVVERQLPGTLLIRVVEREPVAFVPRQGQLQPADADGRLLGVYRKTHIPNAIGYQEKEYFSPGDSGFRVWDTAFGRIGVAICWDQWFPETARCLALQGAEVLLFPTAIGSEPGAAALDSRDHWQLTQRGHAAANIMPVIAANRVGREVATTDPALQMSFYGSSFITDHKGKLIAEADRDSTGVLVRELDLAAMGEERQTWGIYRDRRPEMYGPLLGLDGRQTHVRWNHQGV